MLKELSWAHVESTAMEVDGRDKAVPVSIADGPSFEKNDFAVEPFRDGVGDLMAAVVHNAVQAFADPMGDLFVLKTSQAGSILVWLTLLYHLKLVANGESAEAD